MHEIDLVAFAEYAERICVLSKIMGSEVDLHKKIFSILVEYAEYTCALSWDTHYEKKNSTPSQHPQNKHVCIYRICEIYLNLNISVNRKLKLK
jgi:hypothetical protein